MPLMTSEDECQQACILYPDCQAVDFDRSNNSCVFHRADTVCGVLTPRPFCTHYRYVTCRKYIILISNIIMIIDSCSIIIFDKILWKLGARGRSLKNDFLYLNVKFSQEKKNWLIYLKFCIGLHFSRCFAPYLWSIVIV